MSFDILHPSGYIDTSTDCHLQRQKSDPNKEAGGITLDQCVAKYQKQFQLPLKNIQGYIRELQSSWDRLSPEDRNLVIENINQNLPQIQKKCPQQNYPQQIENFSQEKSGDPINNFINDYILLDPINNTIETLNTMYSYNNDDIKKGFNSWIKNQNISFCYENNKVLALTIGVCVFALVVGIVIGYFCYSK